MAYLAAGGRPGLRPPNSLGPPRSYLPLAGIAAWDRAGVSDEAARFAAQPVGGSFFARATADGIDRSKLHRRRLPAVFSLVRVEPETVALSALKKAVEGDSIIVRVYNTVGRPAQARLFFDWPIGEVSEATLAEEDCEEGVPVRVDGDGGVTFELGPHEIRTFGVAPILDRHRPPNGGRLPASY